MATFQRLLRRHSPLLRFTLPFLEFALILLTVWCAVMWLNAIGTHNWDALTVLLAALTAATVWLHVRLPPPRFADAGERVRHGEALLAQVDQELDRTNAEQLRQDAVIRDVDRLDAYPEGDDSKRGPSPWFKVGLVGTYAHGVQVALRYTGLKRQGNGFRFVDHAAGEQSDLTACLLGDIPFDSIAKITIDRADDYYSYPHLFCYFEHVKGEPYTRLWFGEEYKNPGGRRRFRELASYDAVKANNPRRGMTLD